MSKTIVVVGFGPGISNAVAEKFGAEGFSVALVGRNQEKLNAGVASLEKKGVKAAAFAGKLDDPKSVKDVIARARTALGPITVLEWTAYSGAAGDLLTADGAALHEALDVATVGLLAAVQESLPDLKKDKTSAVLVTNGGLGLFDAKVDAMGVQFNAMGLSLANAVKHKLVRLLHAKLAGEAYVAEVMVLGSVRGSAFDPQGHASLTAETIAAKFWEIYTGRREVSVTIA
jgi:NADP-dependent 3-hydroxy acid dehydrogenase YdfG